MNLIMRVFTADGMSIGVSVFCFLGLAVVTIQTDRQTTLRRNVCSDSRHLTLLTVLAMRANKSSQQCY